MNREIEQIIHHMSACVKTLRVMDYKHESTIERMGRKMTLLGQYMLEPLLVRRFTELKEWEQVRICRRYMEAKRILITTLWVPEENLRPEEIEYEHISYAMQEAFGHDCEQYIREHGSRFLGYDAKD